MEKVKYDFGGYATRNNLVCSDGLIIRKGAFANANGQRVPLVWNHMHNSPENVLGHADLEERNDGIYANCSFNDTAMGREAKEAVIHGDISALSIYANHVKRDGFNVMHGAIREVSLVLAGANPGAFIDTVIQHSDGNDDEAIMYLGEEIDIYNEDVDEIAHSDNDKKESEEKEEEPKMAKEPENIEKNDENETVQDVIDSMSEKQKKVMYALIGAALEEKNNDDDEEGNDMKHNVFDDESMETNDSVIMHADVEKTLSGWTKYGSMRAAFDDAGIGDISYIKHDDDPVRYGIMPKYPTAGDTLGIDALFPDYKNYTDRPEFIQRNVEWVAKFMGGVSHTPFSRVKSMFADITEDEARAKGYIKGNYKKEEVFSLLKRVTNPTTVYKKQKFDRNDLIDITSFDVVAWVKAEMRVMLNEEIARACLIGDGRAASSDDKIDELCIRPIYKDAALFALHVNVEYDSDPNKMSKNTIRAILKARKNYKGSGNPIFFTTEDVLTDMLLIEDGVGRSIYDTKEKLCTKLRVSDIVTVEVMEGVSRESGNDEVSLIGIIVNPKDYNIGADKGGEVSMFDDFDIDYNQMKYLMETRCSGALIKPYSAMIVETIVEEEEENAEPQI